MARDGSGIYHTPPGTAAVPDTTIESAKYNTNVADVEADLNWPRPIVAGGTGANNARDAMIALSGEIANQVVTNYDSHPFVPGSFTSAPGATAAPEATNYYSGVCHTASSSAIILEAKAYSGGAATGKSYRREKWGAWTAWQEQSGGVADTDARYVNLTGDTMTGPLILSGSATAGGLTVYETNGITVGQGGVDGVIRFGNSSVKYLYQTGSGWTLRGGPLSIDGDLSIAAPNATINLNTPLATQQVAIYGIKGGLSRWVIVPGQGSTEPGGNAGSDFFIGRFSDAGGWLGIPFSINRSNGTVTIENATITGTATASSSTTGAFTVAGGVGIGGDIYTSGVIACTRNENTVSRFSFRNQSAGASAHTAIDIGNDTTGSAGEILLNSSTNTSYAGPNGMSFVLGNNAGFLWQTTTGVKMSLNNSGWLAVGSNYGPTMGAPLMAGNSTSGMWAMSVSGADRGVLYLAGGAASLYGYFCQGTTSNAIGSIAGTTTNVAFNTTSSGELKEDLKTFDAGSIIDDTNVYDFAWKSTGERSYGVIAQQAIDVYPLAVTHVEKVSDEIGEFWGVDYSKYVPVLLQELKALRARVAQLEGGSTDAKPAKKK